MPPRILDAGGRVMKIILEIPDGAIAGFLNCVEVTNCGMQLASYRLDSDDFKDGNCIKLPREQQEG